MKDILLIPAVTNCISKIDSIGWKMRISKKEIYKYFCSEKLVIEKGVVTVHKAVRESIDSIVAKNHNAIKENFEIRKIFKEMFIAVDSSPIYQLKKQYPKIYNALLSKEVHECKISFKLNIEKGIKQGLYRKDLNLGNYISFYYTLIFSANGNTISEKESNKLEFEALEYHTRTMATPKGIIELEKQTQYFII
jgi:hypothetical protein